MVNGIKESKSARNILQANYTVILNRSCFFRIEFPVKAMRLFFICQKKILPIKLSFRDLRALLLIASESSDEK
jgi:hypothetical protein